VFLTVFGRGLSAGAAGRRATRSDLSVRHDLCASVPSMKRLLVVKLHP